MTDYEKAQAVVDGLYGWRAWQNRSDVITIYDGKQYGCYMANNDGAFEFRYMCLLSEGLSEIPVPEWFNGHPTPRL